MTGLGMGLLSAAAGLFFVLRDAGDLDASSLFMWIWLLGAPMVVGGRHLHRLTRARPSRERSSRQRAQRVRRADSAICAAERA